KKIEETHHSLRVSLRENVGCFTSGFFTRVILLQRDEALDSSKRHSAKCERIFSIYFFPSKKKRAPACWATATSLKVQSRAAASGKSSSTYGLPSDTRIVGRCLTTCASISC